MIGIDIILWILVVGTLAVPLNNIFTLGKNISSIFGFLIRKEKKSKTEERFIEISPLASLVQRKLYTRLFVLAIGLFVVIGCIVFITGRFSLESFGVKEWIDIIVVSATVLSSGVIRKIHFLRKHIISDDELSILKEFKNCYLAYIREKRESLGILLDTEKKVLKCLTANEAKNLNEIEDSISQENTNFQISKGELKKTLKRLQRSDSILKKRKHYYLKR